MQNHLARIHHLIIAHIHHHHLIIGHIHHPIIGHIHHHRVDPVRRMKAANLFFHKRKIHRVLKWSRWPRWPRRPRRLQINKKNQKQPVKQMKQKQWVNLCFFSFELIFLDKTISWTKLSMQFLLFQTRRFDGRSAQESWPQKCAWGVCNKHLYVAHSKAFWLLRNKSWR